MTRKQLFVPMVIFIGIGLIITAIQIGGSANNPSQSASQLDRSTMQLASV